MSQSNIENYGSLSNMEDITFFEVPSQKTTNGSGRASRINEGVGGPRRSNEEGPSIKQEELKFFDGLTIEPSVEEHVHINRRTTMNRIEGPTFSNDNFDETNIIFSEETKPARHSEQKEKQVETLVEPAKECNMNLSIDVMGDLKCILAVALVGFGVGWFASRFWGQ
jgi:hypothetical protein